MAIGCGSDHTQAGVLLRPCKQGARALAPRIFCLCQNCAETASQLSGLLEPFTRTRYQAGTRALPHSSRGIAKAPARSQVGCDGSLVGAGAINTNAFARRSTTASDQPAPRFRAASPFQGPARPSRPIGRGPASTCPPIRARPPKG